MNEELRAQVEEAVSERNYYKVKDRLALLYQAVFCIPLDIECNKCIFVGRKKLKEWLLNPETKIEIMANKIKQKIKEKFLPEGGQMRVRGYAKVITVENLTQSDIDWLKKNGHENMIEDCAPEAKTEKK